MREFFKRDLTPYVIVGFLALLLITFVFNYNKPLSYKMTTSAKPTVDQPVTVGFEVEKRMAHYSPDTFSVELTNKYNSNDTYKFELDPYQEGFYEFTFTPNFSGDYLVKLKLNFDGSMQYFTESINVEQ